MIDFVTFKTNIKDAISVMQVPYMGKKVLEKLKALFIVAMDENVDLKTALPDFHRKFTKLDMQMQDAALAAIPMAVNDVLKPYLCNQFANILSQYLQEEENVDEVDELEIQARFSINLITHLNKVLVRWIDAELKSEPVECEEDLNEEVIEVIFCKDTIKREGNEAVAALHTSPKNDLSRLC